MFVARSRWLTVQGDPARCAGWAAALLMVVLCGCRQDVIRARNVPPKYMAPPLTNAQRLDLSPLARATLQSERIYPGDLLEVAITTGLDTEPRVSPPLRVSEQGVVDVPLVGPVRVGGLELQQAEHAIRDQSIQRQMYRAPNVSLRIQGHRTNQITVMGAVSEPNVVQLHRAKSDLLAAIVAAGGLTEEADTLVEIRYPASGGPAHVQPAAYPATPGAGATIRVDLANPDPGLDYYLPDGSVVTVRRKPERTVQVLGLVNKPDQYEIPLDGEFRVLDALALAGDRRLQLADKVHVIRHPPGQEEPLTIGVSVRDAKRSGADNLRLAPGDVVIVEETPATFIMESLQNFIRFGFTSAIPGI